MEIRSVGKQYLLGEIGTGTLSHDLKRWWSKASGKGDPYAMVGEENKRDVAGGDYVWALRDISLEVKQGEVLGIIGKNGAGKSTLLKLLSRVTRPTTGTIKAKGRVASLLEVGTGMHPELTGRENIFLNGAILGMNRPEIEAKFDEIVAFSGCDKYVDTPVKRYSSGMKVRLGFAVAAFLEPEILIVDEVLAVGDAEFQRKAIGKMKDVTRSGSRTVLFVSHNMAAVSSLCTRAVVLKNGTLTYDGTPDEAIQHYLSDSAGEQAITGFADRKGNGRVKVNAVEVCGTKAGYKPQTGQSFAMRFALENPESIPGSDLRFDLRIDDHMGQRAAWLSNTLSENEKAEPVSEISFEVDKLSLNAGLYYVTLYIEVRNEVSDWIQNAFSFEVSEGDYYGTGKPVPINQSNILIDFKVAYDV
ncbi:MAG: ABC transporter ATP-binding protein [Cryomorphaceae bacterium]